MDTITCCFCERKFKTTDLLNNHFKSGHSHINLSESCLNRYVCKVRKCNTTFSRAYKFLMHCKLKHLGGNEKDKYKHQLAQNNEYEQSESDQKAFSLEARVSEIIANLRFSTSITGADLGRCVDATENLLSDVMKQIRDKTKDFLDKKGIDSFDAEAIEFLDSLKMGESFSKFKNMDGQIRALKKHFTYVDPQEKSFGSNEDSTFQYTSLIETLTLVLSNKEVMDYVTSGPKVSDDEYIRSFKDGETYSNHTFFKNFPDAIGIHLYYDEFLVNNPLGSKTHQNKIAALYFSISNLPSHLRDFLGNVHVLAFGLHEDVLKYGIDSLLEPFIVESRLLESDVGYKVNINAKDYILRATLLTVCADSLARISITSCYLYLPYVLYD